jgi:DNA-binding PadR family transcriptional regulator
MNQGTLYPALLKLEQAGWINATWGASETGREVKIYALTKTGRTQLKAAEASWQNASEVVGRFFKIQEGQ